MSELAPGQSCPTCERRVPYPKTEKSPVTRTVSYRIPLDESEAHEEVAQAAARFIGVYDRPYWRYALNNYAYAHVLLDESMKGIASKS